MAKRFPQRAMMIPIAVAALLSSAAAQASGEAPAKKVKIEETIASRDKVSVTLKKDFEAVKGSNGEVTVRRHTAGTKQSVNGTFVCSCPNNLSGGACQLSIRSNTVTCSGGSCCSLSVEVK